MYLLKQYSSATGGTTPSNSDLSPMEASLSKSWPCPCITAIKDICGSYSRIAIERACIINNLLPDCSIIHTI